MKLEELAVHVIEAHGTLERLREALAGIPPLD